VEVGSARQIDKCVDVVYNRVLVVPALEAACRVDQGGGVQHWFLLVLNTATWGFLGHLRQLANGWQAQLLCQLLFFESFSFPLLQSAGCKQSNSGFLLGKILEVPKQVSLT
jgi:hypothetical protein